MINYIEKGRYLHEAIHKAGYFLRQENGVWVSSNDAAVQAIIDSFNPLPDQKKDKIAEIKAAGLTRIQSVFPAIQTFDDLALIREMYLSIAVAARLPTSSWQRMIDIYMAGQNAITQVNNATTKAQVDAVQPSWPA